MAPVVKDSISMAALSVSTTAMISPLVTRSPTLLYHSMSVPALRAEHGHDKFSHV